MIMPDYLVSAGQQRFFRGTPLPHPFLTSLSGFFNRLTPTLLWLQSGNIGFVAPASWKRSLLWAIRKINRTGVTAGISASSVREGCGRFRRFHCPSGTNLFFLGYQPLRGWLISIVAPRQRKHVVVVRTLFAKI
jgi:hypothetical protein